MVNTGKHFMNTAETKEIRSKHASKRSITKRPTSTSTSTSVSLKQPVSKPTVYTVTASDKPQHKYMVGYESKVIYFGDSRPTFIDHKDCTKLAEYLRYGAAAQAKWDDPHTAAFWTKNLLWSLPDMKDAAKDMKIKYSMKVRVKL